MTEATAHKNSPRMFHLLHRVHQALFRASDRILGQELGITTTQSAVLLYLKRRDSASMGELATAVGLKITSMSGLVDRMEKKGLVSRQRSIVDRRTMEIALTSEGRELLVLAEPLVAGSNEELVRKIATVADVGAFAAACDVIINASEDLYARSVTAVQGTENTTNRHPLERTVDDH